MADSIWITDFDAQVDLGELDDLRHLAVRLAEQAPRVENDVLDLLSALRAALAKATHPADAERAAETFAHDLRALWLTDAAWEAASVFRSPTASESRRMAQRHDAFGYERDLQPDTLEQRCARFFPPPPRGWRHEHLIFSSGQAAMASSLIALGARLSPAGTPLGVAHLGGYFETRALLGILPALIRPVPASFADVLVVEPTGCDGGFREIDVCAEAQRLATFGATPRAIILDTTLLGRDDGIDRCLDVLAPLRPQFVLRTASSLKLLQGGLELANGGIASIYSPEGAPQSLADDLRRVRTLIGAGITLADAVALEAPWFLEPDYTDDYITAVFAHNARLAQAVDGAGGRFAPVSHPSLSGGVAPFCAFHLRDAGSRDYDALETEIAAEASRRCLLLARGGSFGFRGHRFEIVRPETGEPPFLRIAMGRRGGWSCSGLIAMMADLSARSLPAHRRLIDAT
jgi:hypothetical protein